MTRQAVAAVIVGCALGAGWAAQAGAQAVPPATPPAASAKTATAAKRHAAPDYVIGPMDVLEVLFWRDKELTAEVVVRPDGKITLPLLNEFDAGGLTPEQLRMEVVERARRFVEQPTANVVVKQINSRNVFILGEVTKPGTYPLSAATSVLQLIAAAGGLTPFAVTDDIVVIRAEADGPVRHRVNYKAVVKGQDLKQNLDLRPGDVVVVP
jgi:polysaccharide export outer membrane protein